MRKPSSPTRAAGIFALLVVAGCVAGQPRDSAPNEIQQMMKGKTRQELLACAGAPLLEEVQNGRTQLVYYREASLLEESFPGSKSSMARVHHGCRAIVVLENERISGIQYESVPDYFHDEEHCDELFESCSIPSTVP